MISNYKNNVHLQGCRDDLETFGQNALPSSVRKLGFGFECELMDSHNVVGAGFTLAMPSPHDSNIADNVTIGSSHTLREAKTKLHATYHKCQMLLGVQLSEARCTELRKACKMDSFLKDAVQFWQSQNDLDMLLDLDPSDVPSFGAGCSLTMFKAKVQTVYTKAKQHAGKQGK